MHSFFNRLKIRRTSKDGGNSLKKKEKKKRNDEENQKLQPERSWEKDKEKHVAKIQAKKYLRSSYFKRCLRWRAK